MATDPGTLAANPLPLGAARVASSTIAGAYDECGTLANGSFQLTGNELTEAMTNLMRLREQADRTLVFLLADALQRGDVDGSNAASAQQWLTALHTRLECREAAQILFVAQGISKPANSQLLLALKAGNLTVAAANVALKQMTEVTAVLPEATHEEALSWYVAVAETGTTKEVRALTKQVVAKYGEDTLSNREAAAQEREDLRWFELPSGFWRMEATMSPAHGAVLAEIISSLSGPRPGFDERGAPAPDSRTPGKRRADALMELATNAKRLGPCTRSASRPMGAPAMIGGPLLSMIVTTDYADLRTGFEAHNASRDRGDPGRGQQPRNSRGGPPGLGRTNMGGYLDPAMLRRYACDAEIIPVVLGTESEPLDVGRSRRLFTTSQRYALAVRDKGCTFPGCDRPPSWCEAHHLIPWSSHGASDFDNATLLCERHHTIVHTKGYLGRLDSDTKRLSWDLVPGELPRQLAISEHRAG